MGCGYKCDHGSIGILKHISLWATKNKNKNKNKQKTKQTNKQKNQFKDWHPKAKQASLPYVSKYL